VAAACLGPAPCPSLLAAPPISIESDSLRIAIRADARAIEFTSKASGINYCVVPSAPFARVKKDGKLLDATKATLSAGRLRLDFDGVSAELKLTSAKHSITVEVLSVTGEGVDELLFANVPLTLKGDAHEPFRGLCASIELADGCAGLAACDELVAGELLSAFWVCRSEGGVDRMRAERVA